MQLSEITRISLNVITFLTMIIVLIIIGMIMKRRKDLSQEVGVSAKTYLIIVGTVEIFYTAGLVMILAAMGINVLEHLQNLELGKFFKSIDSVDVSRMKFVGVLGWIGFGMNCAITFIAPLYLLIKGGKRLPKIIYWSVWTEIILETVVITLIATSLFLG